MAIKTSVQLKRPVCRCIDTVAAMMVDHNTRVATEPLSDAVIVASCKVDEQRRGKPSVIVAAYCPFCGKKYVEIDKPKLPNRLQDLD